MNKQPERKAKTKQALIDSFWNLYCEKRIEKITISQITSGAGFYRSTFYEYFENIYDILDEIENTLLEKFTGILTQSLSSFNLEEALRHFIKFYENYGSYLAVLLGPNGDHNFIIKIKNTAKNLITNKTNLSFDDMQSELVAEILSSTVIAMLNYWYTHKDTTSLETVLTIGSNVMQEGILPSLKFIGFTLH